MYMTVPLRCVSDYSGHTTSICIEVINYHHSLIIPLSSIKAHPIDLGSDGRIDLRVVNYSRQCFFDSITFNINRSPLVAKSTNIAIRLPDTVHISFFDRILFRKISSEMCIYSLLLIANGIAHNIDRLATSPEISSAVVALETPVENDEYLIARETPIANRNSHDYAEMM
jgi:hypothetical protein